MRTGSPLADIHSGGSARTCFIQRPPCSSRPAPKERRRLVISWRIAASAGRSTGAAGGSTVTNCDSSIDMASLPVAPLPAGASARAASRGAGAWGRGAIGRAPTRKGSGAAVGMPGGSSDTLGLRSSGRRRRHATSGNRPASTAMNMPISPLL